jgi:MFS family permease
MIRYSIVILAMAMNILNYADRASISILAPKIRADLGLSGTQMGVVFGIFSIAYALGQAPWGLFAERHGARRLVTGAAVGWSALIAATGLAWSYASLLVIRFLFGAVEAALSPAVAAGFRRWLPARDSAAGFGVFLAGGRLGAAVTPWIAGALFASLTWREVFLYLGPPGVIGAITWFAWYRDVPATHPAIAAEEVALLPQVTAGAPAAPALGAAVRSGRFWSLLGTAFCATFLWQFYITWFPTYLTTEKHLSTGEASFYAGLPFAFGLVGTACGGLITSALSRRVGVDRARRWVGLVSLCSAAMFMSAGLVFADARVAAAVMASAAGWVDLYLGAAWASAVEIGKEAGGGVAGLMNGASNAAAFASPVAFGWLLDRFHDWNLPLLAAVGMTLVAAGLWLKVTAGGRHHTES